ncbi:ABC transporter substrate-binding protein [Noviherbaspirillum cavernae]|uniref:ABC transporter substrate-binding protein n=1 Tax=Noviherbaspirillum cavernae TaxID=2320862 RepID=A0A418WV47_9BURK|nr:ABC transporter substrate-binding protein [Noviherbaspirillum cavernae]RJF96572.1 ABC transporter substrate-binding protein [Noviherbaspirillum cavernae]
MSTRRQFTLLLASAGFAFLSAPYATAQEDTIRVGLILEKSGPFASYGKQMENGIQSFMKIHGDKVAGKKVELFVRDSTGPAPEVAKRLAQELIVNNKVHFLAGFGFTPNALAAAPIATAAKTPMIVMNAAASTISTRSPYIARVSFTTPQVSMPMGDWAGKNGIKKVFTVVSDYGPGHDAETYFKKGFQAGGGQIAGEVRVPLSARDFSSYLQRVKDAKPEAVFVFLAAGEPTVSFMKAYGERGMKQSGIRILSTEGWADDRELNLIGDAAMGAVSTGFYSMTHDSAKNREFVKTYLDIDKSGMVPDFMAVSAYDGMAAIYAVANKLGGQIDGEQAMKVLKGLQIDSPRGPLVIDAETRDPVQTVYVRRVEMRNGKMANVEFDSGYKNVKDPGKDAAK